MYECLNFVAEEEGKAGCVLIRALEPVMGIATMRRRRPAAKRLEDLASGPGKLTLALGITRKQNGADLTRSPLRVLQDRGGPSFEIDVTPRVGITHCADWPLRFLIAGSPFVSR
jgi:DNA-3-methyladenine glycosylase